MPLSPNDRKAELVRRGVKQADIARQLGYSKSHVGQVISGKRRDAKVERLVADAIGKSVRQVFGDAAA